MVLKPYSFDEYKEASKIERIALVDTLGRVSKKEAMIRESLEPMNNMMSNLSKFAKLAWTLTKYRQAGAAAAAAAAEQTVGHF